MAFINHEFPRTFDAGLILLVEIVDDVGDVDERLIFYGFVAVAVDDWFWR
jgi:hypothetical protein